MEALYELRIKCTDNYFDTSLDFMLYTIVRCPNTTIHETVEKSRRKLSIKWNFFIKYMDLIIIDQLL